jgi:hypothetical protein
MEEVSPTTALQGNRRRRVGGAHHTKRLKSAILDAGRSAPVWQTGKIAQRGFVHEYLSPTRLPV